MPGARSPLGVSMFGGGGWVCPDVQGPGIPDGRGEYTRGWRWIYQGVGGMPEGWAGYTRGWWTGIPEGGVEYTRGWWAGIPEGGASIPEGGAAGIPAGGYLGSHVGGGGVLTPSGGHHNTYGWKVASTHPTGMLSCFFFLFLIVYKIPSNVRLFYC